MPDTLSRSGGLPQTVPGGSADALAAAGVAPQPPDPAQVADAVARYRAYHGLREFRALLYSCLASRPDACMDLIDAILCADHAVTSLVQLSLAPEFRRGHGALYAALRDGRIDQERLATLLTVTLAGQAARARHPAPRHRAAPLKPAARTNRTRQPMARRLKPKLERMEQIMRDVCADFRCELAELTGEANHVHLLVNVPPTVAIFRLVNSLRTAPPDGLTSVRLHYRPEGRRTGGHFGSPALLPDPGASAGAARPRGSR